MYPNEEGALGTDLDSKISFEKDDKLHSWGLTLIYLGRISNMSHVGGKEIKLARQMSVGQWALSC